MTFQYAKENTHVYRCNCGIYVTGLPEHFTDVESCGAMPREHHEWLMKELDRCGKKVAISKDKAN